jgi:predicted phosphodiesterase
MVGLVPATKGGGYQPLKSEAAGLPLPFFSLARSSRMTQNCTNSMSRHRLALLGVLVVLSLLAISCRTTPTRREAGAPTRIALISDLHVMGYTTNVQQRLYPLRLAKAVEAINQAHVDVVVVAGDLTEHGKADEFARFKHAMRGFQAPVCFVPGNHDVGNKAVPGGKKEATNFGRTRNYELDFGRCFFAREYAGVRILGVNSCLFGTRLPRERQMWDFLEEQLAAPSKKPTLLVQHHPPFLKKVDEPGGEYFNMEPYPRARLLALAKQGGAIAVLSGHLHHGLTNQVDGTVLLTTPPISFGLQDKKPLEGWMLLTVAGTNLTWSFQPLTKVTLPTTPAPAKRRTAMSVSGPSSN